MRKGRAKHSRPKPGEQFPADDARRVPPRPDPYKITISFERCEIGGRFCLSTLEASQIVIFLDCLRKLTERTWQQVIDQSSKDPAKRTGLNATQYSKTSLNNPDIWPG